jgi:ABC-type lipoprotein release transport system permease subunit
MLGASTWRIAWRNLGRNRKRTALALGAIALAQTMMLFMNGFTHGYVDLTVDALTGPLFGHLQLHDPKFREERGLDQVVPRVSETLAALRKDPAIATAAGRIWSPALVALKEEAVAALVVGLDPAAEAGANGLLREMTPGALAAPKSVAMGKKLADKLGATVGSTIVVVGQGADGSIANDLFTVAAVISTPADAINRLGVVMSLASAQELLVLGDAAHEIVVHLHDAGLAAATADRLAKEPAFAGLEVLDWKRLAPELASVAETSEYQIFMVLILVFVASAAGVANTMLMATFERKHELGMLLALGCTPGRLVRLLLAESVLLGLAGVAVGSLLGWGLVSWLGHSGLDLTSFGGSDVSEFTWEGMSFSLTIFPRIMASDIGRGVTAVVVTALLAAIWPAALAARLQPVEAMRA